MSLILQLSCECKLRSLPPALHHPAQVQQTDARIALGDWVKQREMSFLCLTAEQLLDCEAITSDCISTSNLLLGYALQVGISYLKIYIYISYMYMYVYVCMNSFTRSVSLCLFSL